MHTPTCTYCRLFDNIYVYIYIYIYIIYVVMCMLPLFFDAYTNEVSTLMFSICVIIFVCLLLPLSLPLSLFLSFPPSLLPLFLCVLLQLFSGLEDQLLGLVVAEERPDLEEAKNALIVSNAKMMKELKEIEDQILYRLSNSEGNPVDDVDLIKVLEASKIKSGEIKV